jgi:hypothetical protein
MFSLAVICTGVTEVIQSLIKHVQLSSNAYRHCGTVYLISFFVVFQSFEENDRVILGNSS